MNQRNGTIRKAGKISKYLPLITKPIKLGWHNSKSLAVTLKSNVKIWIEKNQE